MAEETQDGQKTLVAFVVGLLIGGMLVWAFSGPSANAPDKTNDKQTKDEVKVSDNEGQVINLTADTKKTSDDKGGEPAPALQVGQGEVVVLDQPAGTSVKLDKVTYPVSEGWIGVREYNNDKLGFILGVVRFSESRGSVPSEIFLQRSTTAGKKYAVVIFTENGDSDFNLAGDVQIDEIFATFVAK